MIAHVKKLDRALEAFTGALLDGMGRPERRRAMGWYIEGLLLDGLRKSIEPMAARLVDDPAGDRGDAPAAAAMRLRERLVG